MLTVFITAFIGMSNPMPSFPKENPIKNKEMEICEAKYINPVVFELKGKR